MQQEADIDLQSRRLWGWLPTEVPWLVGAGILFHFLAQVHWAQIWKGFVYDPILRWWLPLVFFVAALYVGLGALPRPRIRYKLSLNPQWIVEIGLALGAVLYIKYCDPITYVDDVGFILRYLDHFADGCFYCFNVQDGAVFGISSFVYGLLAGFLTWTHIFNPEGALSFLTYLGVFTTGFLFFRILRQVVQSQGAVILLWFVLMTCSRSMALIYNSGMEAPVHFSLVLAALLFFLLRKDRLMWLFLAISVISKLDAVPMVLVVGMFWVVENWADLKQFDWYKKRYHDALLYGLVPVVIWIAFATIIFGSPLPQSAYAKTFFMKHAEGSWFPFIQGFTTSAYQSIFLACALALFLVQLGYVAALRKGGRGLVFGFACIATLLLYYFYNPVERMLWYYVLPEGLMLLQLCVSVVWVWGWMPAGKYYAKALPGVCIAVGFACMFTWMHTRGEIHWQRDYQGIVETERIRIGDYLNQVMAPEDTLLSGHGLISRKFSGYVVDETGLNFAKSNHLKHENRVLWDHFKPDRIVMHGYNWEVDKLNEFPYVLDTSFFDIEAYGYPAWRVFKRVPSIEESEGTYFLQYAEILGKDMEFFEEPTHFLHLKSEAFSFARGGYNKRETKLTFGLLRHDLDYVVHLRDRMPNDSIVWEQSFTVACWDSSNNSRICPVTVPLLRRNMPDQFPPGPRYLIMEFEGSYGKVALYDPAISILRKDPW